MINTEKVIERREHKRFRVKEGAYALIGNKPSRLGQIKNISRGGLAFSYIVNGEEINGSFKVDIFISGQGFSLKDVPSKKISDFHIDNKLPFSTFAIRQSGIQFDEMNHSQLSQLDHFIQNHTMGEEI